MVASNEKHQCDDQVQQYTNSANPFSEDIEELGGHAEDFHTDNIEQGEN
nr:hypothetical protein [Leptothoe kymatousa]